MSNYKPGAKEKTTREQEDLVYRILKKWTGLNLAIDHTTNKSELKISALIQRLTSEIVCLLNNNYTQWQTLATFLEEFMDREFNTILEDNSHNEVAYQIWHLSNVVKNGVPAGVCEKGE